MKKIIPGLLLALLALTTFSCKKEDTAKNAPTLQKQWIVPVETTGVAEARFDFTQDGKLFMIAKPTKKYAKANGLDSKTYYCEQEALCKIVYDANDPTSGIIMLKIGKSWQQLMFDSLTEDSVRLFSEDEDTDEESITLTAAKDIVEWELFEEEEEEDE